MGWKILERFRSGSARRHESAPVSFSKDDADVEAAEREEYGLPDSGEAKLDSERYRGVASEEAAESALNELEEFKPPRDPSP